MKPSIFIGSSSESLETAQLMESCLKSDFECTIWKEKFFQAGKGTYDTLVCKSILFDYAIFVGGKDDTVLRNGTGSTQRNRTRSKVREKKQAARDNVYLEYGLYAGILTPARTFFVFDKACKPASDLAGITLLTFEDESELRKRCEEIRERIFEEEKLARIGLLPSTSLAVGYFENCIRPTAESLEWLEDVVIDGVKTDIRGMDRKFEIVIPENLDIDLQRQTEKYYRQPYMKELVIQGPVRNLYFRADQKILTNENRILIYDVPQTLRMSFLAVELILKENALGNTAEGKLAKEREVRNFERTLKILMEKDPYCGTYMSIVHRQL